MENLKNDVCYKENYVECFNYGLYFDLFFLVIFRRVCVFIYLFI